MVEQKVISADDAARLALALSGEDKEASPEAAQSVQKIASEGTHNQRRAIQLMAERHTRQEGLALLESEAKTSADWQTVARFAQGIDEDMALKAIKRSVALDPENFRSLAMLATLQLGQGDFADARRATMTAGLLAQTPYEVLLVERTNLTIAMRSGNISGVRNSIDTVLDRLAIYEASVDLDGLPEKFSLGEHRDHPVWLSAATHNFIAGSYTYLDNYRVSEKATEAAVSGQAVDENLRSQMQEYADKAIEHAEQAILGYEKLTPLVEEEDRFSVARSHMSALTRIAYSYFSKGEPDLSAKYSAQTLDLARFEAESGNKAALEALPAYYKSHASYLYQIDDIEGRNRAMRRATDLEIKYAQKYEPAEDLPRIIARLELEYSIGAIASKDDEEALEAAADTFMSLMESAILAEAGVDMSADEARLEAYDKLVGEYMLMGRQLAFVYAPASSPIRSRDAAIAHITRPILFNRKLIKTFGTTHDYQHSEFNLLMLRGDIYFNLEDIQAALKDYQNAYEMAGDIIPVEDEEDVVELCQLNALSRIGLLDVDVSTQAILDAVALGARLDKEGRLSTGHQNFYNQALSMAKARGL